MVSKKDQLLQLLHLFQCEKKRSLTDLLTVLFALPGFLDIPAACSRSVICTPEVTRVPLNISPDGKDGKEKSQRFVLGTDGLWDVMSNQAVGKAAARKSSKSSSHHNKKQKDAQSNGSNSHNDSNHGLDGKMGGAETPKQAASRIMEQCLKNGGNQDDITICVVDVSYQQKG